MTKQASEVLGGWLNALIARVVVGFLFFFAFFMGCWIGGSALHDPDTCWLLALGKQIVESGAIPRVDPFSYTFSALSPDGTVNFDAILSGAKPPEHRTFVPYQWLSEVLFYLSYKLGAGYALLLVVNCVLIMGLLAGPLMLFRSMRSPMLPAIAIVILAVVAASFHFLARPEIFSYLMFLIMFGLFMPIRLRFENNRRFNKRDLVLLVPLAGQMIVWANLHTGFISAFITLALFGVLASVEATVRARVRKSILILPWLAFVSMLLASFINPFGTGLWSYIPDLFFSPINKYIRELSAVSFAQLTEWTFYPYFILGLVVLAVQFNAIRRWKANGKFPIGWMYSIFAPIGVFIAGVCCLRLIPFAAIFLLAELAWLTKGRSRIRSSETKNPRSINERVSAILGAGAWPAVLVILSLFGVFMISTRVVKPTIPQGSNAFPAPFEAIEFLANNLPEGRVFNGAQVGDMMIWHLIAHEEPILVKDPFTCPAPKAKPKVFIDTRFDMYGHHLAGDYWEILNCRPGWQDRFDLYQFDWVFTTPKVPIMKALLKNPAWHAVYQSDDAVILVRANPH